MGKTHKGHEHDDFLWKFQVNVFKWSPDGLNCLDLVIDAKNTFSQISFVEKGEELNQRHTDYFYKLYRTWSRWRLARWKFQIRHEVLIEDLSTPPKTFGT